MMNGFSPLPSAAVPMLYIFKHEFDHFLRDMRGF